MTPPPRFISLRVNEMMRDSGSQEAAKEAWQKIRKGLERHASGAVASLRGNRIRGGHMIACFIAMSALAALSTGLSLAE
jgi:hypothetical protein